MLSFGACITGKESCFGHFKVLAHVGCIWGFGNVVWDFDVFVHFDWKSYVCILFFFKSKEECDCR